MKVPIFIPVVVIVPFNLKYCYAMFRANSRGRVIFIIFRINVERIHIYRPLELASELIKSADVHSRTRGIDLFDFPFICALTTRKISRRRQKLAPPIRHINPKQSSATCKYLIMIIKAHF